MENRWSDSDAARCVDRWGEEYGEALALRTYSSRLLGAEQELVLHGGGNTSVKLQRTNLFGETVAVLAVKASGRDLASVEPADHVAVDLDYLCRLCTLPELTDVALAGELSTHLLDASSAQPSIETPVHAVIPGRFVDHTHADAIVTLTNQEGGEDLVRQVVGDDVPVLPYVTAGFRLARLVAEACRQAPRARAMVWMRHGVVTWGDSARESYDRMIDLVSRAESFVRERGTVPRKAGTVPDIETARVRLVRLAPIVRGLLAGEGGGSCRRRVVLRVLCNERVLRLLDEEGARDRLVSPPLTADHLIRTGPWPAWLEPGRMESDEDLRAAIEEMLARYAAEYGAYLERHVERLPVGVETFAPRPRVILVPRVGALCVGRDAREAGIVRDICAHTLAAKERIAAMGGRYRGLEEAELFAMEYRAEQHAKLVRREERSLAGMVVLITGAAGAIGSGICEYLLDQGAHVAATDLAGSALDGLTEQLAMRGADRVIGVPLDVSGEETVRVGFARVVEEWGGIDALVINAGMAHVAGLEDLTLDAFRRLQRVNVEGTLLLLAEASRLFRRQGTGGDIVLVSTKNVFAPGARFGAYSATKAAAHQLARVASLELAPDDVRVNMVAPDAVFAHGERASGLWAEVGPERMRARGLDASGLQDYYRRRNLLKVSITAEHVACAVRFFLARETPTTGATLPVDGGLPEATPR